MVVSAGPGLIRWSVPIIEEKDRPMRLRAPLIAGTAACLLALATTTASAADGSMSARTCCDPGGASASAYANYSNRYTVDVTNVKLNDLCPGDGDSVYVELQVKRSNTDYYTVGNRRENHAGCKDPNPTSESSWHWYSSAGRISSVRLKVCVDETWPKNDDCAYSNARTNPYS